jgi:hypothetical protein
MMTMHSKDLTESGDFRRWCTRCKREVPYGRLARGSDTCSVECKREDRIAQRRFQKRLALERVLRHPKTRRLAAALEIEDRLKAQCASCFVCSRSEPRTADFDKSERPAADIIHREKC